MKKNYTIAIADNHRIVTGGLKFLLTKSEEISVLACFSSGKAILEYGKLHQADILLLDIFLPDINRIDLCLKLKKLYPKLIILAMGSQVEEGIVSQLLQSGANGYLLKSAGIEEFYECIRQASERTPVFSKEVQAIMEKSNADVFKNIPRLTKREREILLLLIKGMQTQEISETLFISFLTVQTHRRNLLNKFQVKNVIELINFVKSNSLL